MLSAIRTISFNNKNYQLQKHIGNGKFGNIYQCQSENSLYAIKIVKHNNITNNELEIHTQLDHPNIIKLCNSFVNGKYYLMLLELCDCSLYECLIKENQHFNSNDILKIILSITDALIYLKEMLIIHCDIKLENILITNNSIIKICDFGLSIKLQHPNQEVYFNNGTFDYQSPQILAGELFSYDTDIWSLGILFYELIYKRTPYAHLSMKEASKKIIKGKINVLNSNFANIINKMLVVNKRKRITAEMLREELLSI